MKTTINKTHRVARFTLLAVLTILVGSSARALENVEDIIVTNVEGAVAEWTFTMPNYSVTAEVEYLDLYSLSGKNVFFSPENSIGHITEAVEGQKVTVGFDYDASIGNYYFTGNYTSDDVTITVDEVGNGTFTMPAKAVTVTPVLAPQEEYIINLVTATKQTIPETMWMLLFGLEQYYDYDDNTESFLFDLNLDGKNDMQMKVVDNEETGVSVYSVTRLEGADDITSETDLRRPLSYIHNLQYNSVLFLFNAKDIKDAVVTLEKTEYPYDGAEHKPAVTVTLGTTQLTADQDFTISYPADCTSPGTKTITVSGKGMYCGTATKTYEIDGSAIDDVIGLINAIGTVEYTDASKAKIDAARTAYDALKEAQQKLVTNYTTLTTAETTYANLKAAAEQAAKQEAFKNEIKAEDYAGTYDGLLHTITVKALEGATVKYGTEVDKYGTDNPSFKDANTYTVYYEVSSAGLTPVKGSAEVKISRKALTLIADPVEIFEGEDLPTAFMGKITGFVEGEGLTDTDVLTFSLDNPNASVAGDYSITGMLTIPNKEAAKSGDYGTNYTFSNAAENATALTIKKQVQKKTIEASWITVDVGDGLTYNGDFQKPAVTVTDGETTLSAETDYDVTYSNNKNACEATAENAPTVTVTAKETSTNYTSSASMNFTIGKATVTASGFTVKDKEKDGDDQMAELITTGVKLDGVITGSGDNQGDQVGIKGVTGIFEDADVGEDKTVNLDFTNASLTGNDAANYTLDKANSQQTATGRLYIHTETTVDGDGNVIETTNVKVKDADGFVLGSLGTTKTTKKASDGSITGTISELAKENNNGTVFASGEATIIGVVADGKTTETTVSTYKDDTGGVTQTTQTVKTTKKDADGKTTETVKEKLTDRNGTEVRVTETVKETVKDADGKTIETIKEKVSEAYLDPIRTIVTDKKIVKTPDGKKTETINATATEVNDKTITTTASVIETKADGSLQETKTVTHADNSVTVTVTETVKNADDSRSITIINTEKDAGGEITETKKILKKIEMGGPKTETIQETITAADGTTTTFSGSKITEWGGSSVKHLSEKAQKTVKDAAGLELGSSQTVKRLYLDAHFNIYYSIETIEEKWKNPDGSSTETKEVIEANANGTVLKYSKDQTNWDAHGNQVKKSEESLENGSQVDISGVSNTQLAIPEGIAGRVSLVSEGTSENMRQSIIVSKGKAVQMALPNAKKGGKFQINYASEVSKAKFRKNAMAFRGDKPGMRNSRTRGAEDEMIEIVSGEEYLVLQDGPLVLTFDVEEGPISIESITLKDPDPNDLDGSGKVDAVDLVKAIGAGKTQAEIDAIVNAIMQK